jgi:hypothetical protein
LCAFENRKRKQKISKNTRAKEFEDNYQERMINFHALNFISLKVYKARATRPRQKTAATNNKL